MSLNNIKCEWICSRCRGESVKLRKGKLSNEHTILALSQILTTFFFNRHFHFNDTKCEKGENVWKEEWKPRKRTKNFHLLRHTNKDFRCLGLEIYTFKIQNKTEISRDISNRNSHEIFIMNTWFAKRQSYKCN